MRPLRPGLLFQCSAFIVTCAVALGTADARKSRKAKASSRSAPFTTIQIPPTAHALHAYQSAWEVALRDFRRGEFQKAAEKFAAMEGGDSLASLYRSVLLAQARLRAGDTLRADAVLAALQASRTLDVVWQRHLHRLRLQTLAVLPPAARRAYLVTAVQAPLDNNDRADALYRLLALDTAVVARTERYGLARQLLPLALPGARLDREYRRWIAAVPAADTTRETQRLLLDWEEKLGLSNEAIARAGELAARDSGSEAARNLLGRIALGYYNKGSYGESIQQYMALRSRYGETPEILIQLARAHRALGQTVPADAWYSRLVERFPTDVRSAETLWMRAFDAEMLGNTDSALATYGRIARDFPLHPRGNEALFRTGLIRYRRGDFLGAQRAFAELHQGRINPGLGGGAPGRLRGAARYWEGKALAAIGSQTQGGSADSGNLSDSISNNAAETAQATWIALAREFPFGHYGHMARQELVRRNSLPDSMEWRRLLNPATGEAVRAWFGDSASGVFGESQWLPISRLFTLNLDTLAVLTLQARANAQPRNLWWVYDAAVSCRKAGFGYEAYRFAVRLSDKLPIERWPAAPVEVLRLFYPPSYAELVRPEAARAGMPPGLALALIKQESGFDPGAVSRVGARGLMQLMPQTGTEQARKEGMKGFHPDALFVPAVNIRLGVAYLRDVLRRHHGSIEFALAHYNAGPTALERWMPRLEGRPPEEAVEDIGYAETREYVKRVSANWRTYQVLWGDVNP
jgi:soluble lytic murein transglycosylase